MGGGVYVCALALVLVTGCNSNPPVAPVSGIVTLDGEPLKFGTVMFQHTEGGQPAVGEIQSDGTFALSTFNPGDGAIVGSHLVRVACYTSQDPANAENVGDSLGELLIPRQYTIATTSSLTADVPEDGLSDLQLELEKGRRGRRR